MRPTRRLLLVLLIPFGLVLAGCNTLQGAGEDIEGAGEAISDEAAEQQQR